MANYDPTIALAELLSPTNSRARPLDELGFHQGIVTEWDGSTGENTIIIAGASITDVPLLNIGDTTNLIVGDVVAVIRYRNAYFVIGRVVQPNTINFASASFAYDTRSRSTANIVIPSTTAANLSTVTMELPDWANYAILNARVDVNAFNQTGARDTLYTYIDVNGVLSGPVMVTDVDVNRIEYLGSTYFRELIFNGTPGTTWTVSGMAWTSNNAFSTSGFNHVLISASVVYMRR